MDYLSTSEISKKWKISQRRISLLAAEGKISGAKKVANSWLIPSHAVKPLDSRYTANKKINEGKVPFRFPIYSFSVGESPFVHNSLSKDEKLIVKYEKIFYSNNMEDSYPLFLSLHKTTANPFVRISCLYHMAFTDMLRQDFQTFEVHLNALKIEVNKYNTKYPSLKYIIDDIEIIMKGNINFDIINDYSSNIYDRSSYSYITTLEFYQNVFCLLSNIGNTELSFYECVCTNYENEGFYFVCEHMHIYLGVMYMLLHKDKQAKKHIKKALDIAVAHNVYSIICEYYTYLFDYLDKMFKDYPKEVKEKIITGNKLYLNSVNAVARHYVGNDVAVLNITDYRYISCAIKDIPNKVMAYNLGISESRISAKYNQLYEKFNVGNKKELVEKIKGSIVNPYLILS